MCIGHEMRTASAVIVVCADVLEPAGREIFLGAPRGAANLENPPTVTFIARNAGLVSIKMERQVGRFQSRWKIERLRL
jgi:hypothetical protein